MIANQDRSGWFGGSDASHVVAKNRKTKSWVQWWLEKLDLHKNTFVNKAMQAGTHWEHKILEAVNPKIRKDHQILIEKLRLRVNLDGDLYGTIYEVKTYKNGKEFKVTKAYWRQAQAEMYALRQETGRKDIKLYIVAYALEPEEYDNYFLPVDESRITYIPIEYDKDFINTEFLPKLKELCRALRKGKMPQ